MSKLNNFPHKPFECKNVFSFCPVSCFSKLKKSFISLLIPEDYFDVISVNWQCWVKIKRKRSHEVLAINTKIGLKPWDDAAAIPVYGTTKQYENVLPLYFNSIRVVNGKKNHKSFNHNNFGLMTWIWFRSFICCYAVGRRLQSLNDWASSVDFTAS